MTQLGLGTVQLGLPYGNNALGPLMPFEEAAAIVRSALEGGIRFFDTAHAYGESEARLGQMHLGEAGAAVSTKIPRVGEEIWGDKDKYLNFLEKTCDVSCARLAVSNLGLLQFHQCDVAFLRSPVVRDVLGILLDSGRCERIGFSLYEADQAYAALELPFTSALQVPINIIDDRFLTTDLIKLYKNKNIQLIARSVFMQGILIPDVPLPPVRRKLDLEQLRRLFAAAILDNDPIEVCLRFLLKNLQKSVSIALIGVDSRQSLEVNLRAAAVVARSNEDLDIRAFKNARDFAAELKLLNPADWNC